MTTTILLIATAVASASVAGAFFTFSGFVLRALDDLPSTQAADAMRAVNRRAVTPPFMLLLFGTAILHIATAVLGGTFLAMTIYLVGTIIVTIAGNVPLNNRLEAGGTWSAFVRPWRILNAIRMLAAAASSISLLVTLSS